MRIALGLATLAASAGLAVAAGGADAWYPVLFNDEGIGLVDLGHLSQDAGVTSARLAIVFRAPNAGDPGAAAIAVVDEEFDCQGGRGRTLSNIMYDARGTELRRTTVGGPMAAINPAANIGKLMKVACAPPAKPEEIYPDLPSARKGVLAGLATQAPPK